MMDNHKISDNFNGVEGSKVMLPLHSHPTNGVGPSDSNRLFLIIVALMLLSGCMQYAPPTTIGLLNPYYQARWLPLSDVSDRQRDDVDWCCVFHSASLRRKASDLCALHNYVALYSNEIPKQLSLAVDGNDWKQCPASSLGAIYLHALSLPSSFVRSDAMYRCMFAMRSGQIQICNMTEDEFCSTFKFLGENCERK